MIVSKENPLKILLFDMDGVLLVSAGYHRALQETVKCVGQALGFSAAHVSPETIAQFEAAGTTSEWDSSAICTALLLIRLWESSADGQFSIALRNQPLPRQDLSSPDFLAFAQKLAGIGSPNISPLARAEKLLVDQGPDRPDWQTAHIQEILRGARDIDRSITHQIFQELVLGSTLFGEIYDRRSSLDETGYLVTYDQTTLDLKSHKKLRSWLAKPNQSAAIFTNRPTREPGDQAGTPEGELGQNTTGLQDVPLIGWGQLTWLSDTRDLEDEAFGKPAPGHALAALQCALGVPMEGALRAAADLQLGQKSTGWEALAGAQIYAFEDGAAGLVSTRAAGELLANSGVHTEIHLFGISQEAPKRQALAKVGGQLFPNLTAGLRGAGVLKD